MTRRNLLCAIGGLFALAAIGWTTHARADVSVGQKIEPFTLTNTSNDQPYRVGDWHANGTRATVLIFVSIRCPVSMGYNTRMAELARHFEPLGVRFYGINANVGEPIQEVAQQAKTDLGFTVLKDKGDVIADRFGARVTPEVYVIGSHGDLLYHGRIDDSREGDNIHSRDLHSALEAILAGRPVPVRETQAFGCSIKRSHSL